MPHEIPAPTPQDRERNPAADYEQPRFSGNVLLPAYIRLYNAERAAREAAEAELKLWRPLTPAEAEQAFAEAEASPMSEERIQEILKAATDPAVKLPNNEQAQMAVRVSDLRLKRLLLIAKLEAAEAQRDRLAGLLRTCEWGYWQAGQPCCPSCKEWKYDGHAPGCEIDAALKEIKP